MVTIEKTLLSVANQSYENIEHIIVDGNSKDNTIDICKSYSHISKILSEPDKGVYDAFNKGIKLATGDVIGFLNADDTFYNENSIQDIVDAFFNNETDIVYGNLDYLNEESKVISLEEEVEQNFVLKSPTKGKIYRGSNWNAYNRESLGSIPRSSENILFKDKSQENKIAFSSQTGRFNNRCESEKYAYPGPGKYTESNFQEKLLKNPSHSNKGYGGFISTTDRFDSLREYYEKYLPGPTDYKKDQLFIENKVKNSITKENFITFATRFMQSLCVG